MLAETNGTLCESFRIVKITQVLIFIFHLSFCQDSFTRINQSKFAAQVCLLRIRPIKMTRIWKLLKIISSQIHLREDITLATRSIKETYKLNEFIYKYIISFVISII